MSDIIETVKPIRFTRGSRKHRIGKKSAYHVIAMTAATITTDPDTGETTLSWVAGDERGRELEIVAIERPDCYLVIHVMPTHYRKKGR
jgi:hypothetical protein